MPPITLPDTLRFMVVWGREHDDEVVETFHTERPSVVSLAVLQGLAFDLHTWLKEASNPWRSLKPASCTLQRVIAYDLHPGSNMAGEEAGETPGESSNVVTAHQVSAVITWLTQYRGASYRGRTFVGPLARFAINDNGYLSSSFITSLMAGGGALVGQFAAMGVPMVVASITHQHQQRVVGLQVDNAPDVQRRRQFKATSRDTVVIPE